MYYRDVYDKCKQNEMKTMMKKLFGGCGKEIVKPIFDHKRFFFPLTCLNKAFC